MAFGIILAISKRCQCLNLSDQGKASGEDVTQNHWPNFPLLTRENGSRVAGQIQHFLVNRMYCPLERTSQRGMKMSNNRINRKIQGSFIKIKDKVISFFFSYLILLVGVILLSAVVSQAASLSLSWDPNSEADLAGYKLYYDSNSDGDYQNIVDVGMVTEYEINNLPCGATYRVALSAYDVSHNESELSAEVDVPIPQPNFKLESGEITINHDWIKVKYRQSFTDPVVVANCLSNNDDNPATVRIRNIDKDGFEIRLQEWDYQEQTHSEESVSYLVMERGHFTLEDGTVLEAGSFTTNNTDFFGTFKFCQTFNQLPVIMTSVVSINEPDAVIGRLDNINLSSFDFCLQEQELNDQTHVEETVSFIAWEPSQGHIDELQYEVGNTPGITHEFTTIRFDDTSDTPHVLASMQTTNGFDPGNLRYQDKDVSGIKLKIAEEQSSDSEIEHVAENVGFMIFSTSPSINDGMSDGDNDDTGSTGGSGSTTPSGGSGGAPSGGGGGSDTSSSKPVDLFHSTLNISGGTSINVSITGGTEPYTVTSTNDAIASATITGKMMILTGIADGTATLTITDNEGNSGQIVVIVKTVPAADGNPKTPMTPVDLGTVVHPTKTHLNIAEGKITIAPQLMIADGKSITSPIMLIWLPEAGVGFDISKFTTAKYQDGVLTVNLGTIDFTGFPGTYDIFYGYFDVDGHIHYNAYELTIQ